MNDLTQPDRLTSKLLEEKDSDAKVNLELERKKIYDFLISTVNTVSPEETLERFQRLFLFGEASNNPQVVQAIHSISLSHYEIFFINTLKRCCYILINHWFSLRQFQPIKTLVNLLDRVEQMPPCFSQIIRQVRCWIVHFVNSQDYQELKVFSALGRSDKIDWSGRYASYLLASQYLDPQNPPEQREISRELAKKLKFKFNLELAMYTARYESPAIAERRSSNPTQINDRTIPLIKLALYKNITDCYQKYHLFFDQNFGKISVLEFKYFLYEYLTFSGSDRAALEVFKTQLFPEFLKLHEHRNNDPLSFDLFLTLCRALVARLTTEDGRSPSLVFILLNVQTNPLTLVLILLKLVLICKYTRPHLEVAIAQLIHLYDRLSPEECQWFVQFLEIFQIIFAIYTENVRYNLVKVIADDAGTPPSLDLKAYRVFSQLKGADLHGIDLSQADLHGDELSAADLRGANLSCADLAQADLSLAKLNSANLTGATLDAANLTVVDLRDAQLQRASLKKADLCHANLEGANLSGTNLTHADLGDANLERANLSNANLSGANLERAHLNAANLYGANLSQVNLSHANLRGANLEKALLRSAQLTDADLEDANLQRADLSFADLSRTVLAAANLGNAFVRHAKLNDADLSNADLQGTNFFGTDLDCVKRR